MKIETMKIYTGFKWFLIIAAMLAGFALHSAKAALSVDFNLFYGQLAPYGNWVTVPSAGLVWHPDHEPAHWRPYEDGRWAWTDAGWTWVSYEPWGWAAYHYGRWIYDPTYGWLWVPGSVWAPAWVAWYESPDYIGWAPLGITADININPDLAVFVSVGSFLGPNLSYVAIDPLDNDGIFRHHHFRHFENIAMWRGQVSDPGPGRAGIEHLTGHRVPAFSLASRNLDPGQIHSMGRNVDQLRGNHFYAYRPHVSAARNRGTPFLRRETRQGAVVRDHSLGFVRTSPRGSHALHRVHAGTSHRFVNAGRSSQGAALRSHAAAHALRANRSSGNTRHYAQHRRHYNALHSSSFRHAQVRQAGRHQSGGPGSFRQGGGAPVRQAGSSRNGPAQGAPSPSGSHESHGGGKKNDH